MKLCATVLGLSACSAAFSGSARADWEYTRWGMTAAQVIAASNGAAAPMPSASVYRSSDYEISVGAWLKGPPSLDVGFMFDLPGGGLRCVVYNATDADAEMVRAMLVQRHGKPARESSFGPTRTLKWKTPDDIALTLGDKPVAAVVSHCAPGRG
jgi:hypothetical protein